MKKLMIAACAVAFAAVAQAASVTWESGAFSPLETCTPGFTVYEVTGSGDGATGCIKAFVWESATAFTYESAADVFAAYQKGELKADDAKTGFSDIYDGTVNVTGAGTWADNQDVYAAVLYLHNDELDFDNPTHYMGALKQGVATDIGGSVQNIGSGEWAVAAVPEPTSGLLLLLGVAGLALRRRRA